MKKHILLIFTLIINVSAYSQEKKVCYVLYRNLDDPSWTYPHWFDNTKLTYTSEITYQLKDFPAVLDNGKIIHTADTITYKKQYLEFKNDLNKKKEDAKTPISVREYSSIVLRKHSYILENKYLVVDTIANMANWNILEDTVTILGFNCQKATINYKGKNYVAFFTTKLAFPAGPRNYRGLPGLILKVFNAAATAGYEAIEINYPFKGKVPVLETDGNMVSQNQYEILVDKSNLERMKMLNNFLANPTVKPN